MGQLLSEENRSGSRSRLGTHEMGGPEAHAPVPNNWADSISGAWTGSHRSLPAHLTTPLAPTVPLSTTVGGVRDCKKFLVNQAAVCDGLHHLSGVLGHPARTRSRRWRRRQ